MLHRTTGSLAGGQDETEWERRSRCDRTNKKESFRLVIRRSPGNVTDRGDGYEEKGVYRRIE